MPSEAFADENLGKPRRPSPTRILYVPEGGRVPEMARASSDVVIEGDRITKDPLDRADTLLPRLSVVSLANLYGGRDE